MSNVVNVLTDKEMVARDQCPKCRGELDTGWECNDCGFDAQPIAKRPITAEELAKIGRRHRGAVRHKSRWA